MAFLWKSMVALLLWLSLSSSAWGSAPSQNYVVILLDASGSMKQSDPQFLRRDATNLLISLLRDGDRLVLAEFGDEVRSLTDGVLVLNSQTRQTVRAATEKLSAQYQHTDILAACQYALQMVSALPSEVRQSFVPSVILMTDGKDDVPGKPRRTHLIEEKSKEIAKLGATVHTVGFSAAADLTLLRAIADLTGGDVCVINHNTDLLRGFFGLSRVLGKRWDLSEQLVGGGSMLLSLPEWAKRVVACYLPKSRSNERLQTQLAPDQEIVRPSYQLLRYNQLPNATLKLQIPSGGGMLLVDAEDELVFQALVGKKVPARIPFGIQARILPARVAAMGQPHFLTQMAMLITLKQDGRPEQTLRLYDDGRHDDGPAGDGLFGGYVSGLREGLWRYRIVARAPLSPPLATEGQTEVLAAALTVSPPGKLRQYLWTPFTKQVSWKLCNQTDLSLTGEFSLKSKDIAPVSQKVIWQGGQCQEVHFALSSQVKPGEAL